MIRNLQTGFWTQPQPLALLRAATIEASSQPPPVCQQSVSAIEDVGNGIHLMGPERNLGLILLYFRWLPSSLWPDTVDSLIGEAPSVASLRFGISPDPVRKFLFDLSLLPLSYGGLLRIQNSDPPTVSVIRIIRKYVHPADSAFPQ